MQILKKLKKTCTFKTITKNDKTYLISIQNLEWGIISSWTSIPLTSDNYSTINNIIEIPQYTFPKNQLDPTKKNHPILQDTRKIENKKKLRYYQQSLLFNYGFLPQTWENNKKINKKYTSKFFGDNDPLDTCEISGTSKEIGIPYKCEILGALGLIDQNELDWKIILVEKNFYDSLKFNNKDEAREYFKNKVDYIRNWFRFSKTFERKKENAFLEEGKLFTVEESLEVVKSYYEEYKDLRNLEEYREERKEFNLEE